jgi:hypothetical protein
MGKRRVLLAGVAVVLGGTAIGGVAIANGSRDRLRAELAGTNELPATDPDARGRAKVELDVVGGEVCFSVRFDATGTPNRGHIHVGDATQNGGIVVPLFELVGMPADARNDALEEGRLEGCVPAAPALLQAIADNPGGYYVNLHNARFPGGAARGQLE